METMIRNVGDIDANDRQALEHMLGQRLRDNQQLVIRVLTLQVEPSRPSDIASHDQTTGSPLPEWCNVYAGLSDEQIADLEATILTRADLTRPSE